MLDFEIKKEVLPIIQVNFEEMKEAPLAKTFPSPQQTIIDTLYAPVQEPAKDEPLYFIEFRIKGNKHQTAALGSFLSENGYEYEVLNKGIAK